ncbi:MAG: hypothetical protein U0521_28010 [Anaerolineae bacterium]
MALSEQIAAAGIIPFAHANSDWKGVNEWFVGEMLNHVAGPQAVYEALTGARPWTDDAFAQSIDILNQCRRTAGSPAVLSCITRTMSQPSGGAR